MDVFRSNLVRGALCAGIIAVVSGDIRHTGVRAQQGSPTPQSPHTSAGEVVNKYCVGCHNAKQKTAGLSLDSLDLTRAGEQAAVLEKVAAKLHTREMPPPGRPRPDATIYAATTRAIELALDTEAAARPHPGRVGLHRLNRAEYANAVRDLLDIQIDGKTLLPAEEAAQEGFDNIASVLSASPALIENYLSAARTVSRLALGDAAVDPVVRTFKIPKHLTQDDHMNGLPFGSQGGASIRYLFPVDGEYSVKALLRRQLYDYVMGMGEPHQLDIRIDGTLLKRFNVGGEARGMSMPLTYAGNTQGDPEFEVYMHQVDAHLEVRVPVRAGVHEVSVSFVRRFWEGESFLQPPPTGFFKATNESYHGNPAVEFIMVGGPYGKTAPGDSASRQKVFICRPAAGADDEPCARKILSGIAARAYRRPLDGEDVRILMDFYRAGRADEGFEGGIRRGLEWILTAPSFLFRFEREPVAAASPVYSLTDIELASRLSFFLWSSIPDEELIALAMAGRLRDPSVIDRQVRRMLRDARARALVDNFAARWLELGKLSGVVLDADLYSDFDENLRDAMAQETRLFLADQLRRDRSILELLTADYTFLNDRLARHYGVPDIYGSHFRRVALPDARRGGLLGQASVLTITSYANRTSVVTRGKWVLANLLGAPPPPPPPDVPQLRASGEEAKPRSMRERLEVHRQNPVCATCHVRMDPIGFALENFDADGAWRAEADGLPIDASASLPDGTRFDGLSGLRSLFVSHKEDFARTLAAKLLAYAIGRGVEHYDLPAIRKIAREAAASDYRWSAMISGIARSTPFTMSTARGSEATQSAGN